MPPWHLRERRELPRNRIPELLLEQGRVSADSIRRSGEIWANAIAQGGAGIGGAIRDIPEQREREEDRLAIRKQRVAAAGEDEARTSMMKQQAEDQQALRVALESSKARDEILAQTPGHLRATVQKHWDEADERANKLDKAKLEYLGGLASAVKGLPPEMRAASMAGAVTHMRARGYNAEAEEAEALSMGSPEQVEAILDSYITRSGIQPKTREIKVRNADGTESIQIVEDRPGQKFTSAPDLPKVGTPERYMRDTFGQNPTPEQQLQGRKTWEAQNDRPRDPVAAELAALRLADAKKKSEQEVSTGDQVADAWAKGLAFPTTQEATTAALESFKRRGLEVPRKLGVALQKEAIATADTIATIEDVEQLYQKVKDKIGPVTYSFNEWARKIPGTDSDPDFVAFNTALRGMGNLEIERITGAQMGEKEAARLLKAMATGSLKPGDFEAALGIMKRNATRTQSIMLYGKVPKMEPQGRDVGKVSVTAPDGSKHTFDSQAQANEFKRLAGIK